MSRFFASALGIQTFILPLLAGLAFGSGPGEPATGERERFLVDYSPDPSPSSWEGFGKVILDPSAKVELPARKVGGPEVLAYLSLVEIAPHAAYEKEAREARLVLENLSNEVWHSSLADITKPGWRNFVVHRLARAAAKKGFQGFFLDTADSIQLLPGAKDPATLAAYQKELAALIVELRKAYPGATVVLNRGFGVVEHLPPGTLEGVLIESVYQSYDHGSKTYAKVAAGDTQALEEKVADLRERGLAVYVIDYVDPSRPELAAATAKRIEALGASALITTPELQGLVLAPATTVARKLLVLYGFDPALKVNDPKFVPDTSIARHFQTPLEWMGYELRYHMVAKEKPGDLNEEFCGILVDADVALTPAEESWYVDWLLEQCARGKKILFAGAIPFSHSDARRKLLGALGIRGSGRPVRGVREVVITAKDDEIFDYEVEVRPATRGFVDLTAPLDSTVLLQVQGKDRHGRQANLDAAFVAEWGGAIFDPYWRFQPYAKDTLSYLDPYRFLAVLWPQGMFPAPDATTREGLRVFWAHVDGDAFATYSTVKRNTTCAEMVRDRILKRYPLPTTISVIEAELRAIQDTQNPADSPRYEAIARDIFRLPHVEAASHGFSHPFVWSDQDVAEKDYYDRRHLHLKASHRFDKIDPRREIEGSVKYIERELLPPGKKVKIMLWTGNCRPFAEALRVCREIGIEAMNGGLTIYSPRHPQNSAVAPRVTWWDDELQVYAANQNEFVYTDDWSGPTFGGFEQVIKSFEMLDRPRRLKPVNVYYHFYSAVSPGSLKALERVYEWSMEQPLHAITASQASCMTRDAVMTRMYRTGPKRWLISNQGALTTFRIPESLGYPDLDASTNVTGFNDHGSERYIHTNGQPVAELVLSPEPPQRLFLKSSEAALEFAILARRHCSFRSAAYKPATLTFGGAGPGSKWTLSYSEHSKPAVFEQLRADAAGQLTFTLPKSAEATLAPATAPGL